MNKVTTYIDQQCRYREISGFTENVVQRIFQSLLFINYNYRDADKSLARPGRKQATATEDSEFHISYL